MTEPRPHNTGPLPEGAPGLPALLARLKPALPEDAVLYVVGGAVRDHLLGRPIHDLDFAVFNSGLKIARRAADQLGAEYYPLDAKRGTGRVLVRRPAGGRLVLDFAELRAPTLEADLALRDFTMNAIAMDAHDPEVVHDPLGGAADLRAGRIRMCAPDAFTNDPVRLLRAVRLAVQLGFKIEAGTRRAMRAAAGMLGQPSAERTRDEMIKILGGRRPAAALHSLDILGIFKQVFPDLDEMKGETQPQNHVHDVWNHTLSVLRHLETLLDVLSAEEHDEEAAGTLVRGLAVIRLGRFREKLREHLAHEIVPDRPWRALLFLAALYHDAGKPGSRSVEEDGRIRFIKHDAIGAAMVRRRGRALALSNEEISRVKTVVRHHMRPHFLAWSDGPPTRRAIYRYFRDTGDAGVDIALLNLADILGKFEQTLTQEKWEGQLDIVRTLIEGWWEAPRAEVLPDPLINGHVLMEEFGVEPGPRIGEVLEQLREAQAAGEVADRAGALEFVEDLLQER